MTTVITTIATMPMPPEDAGIFEEPEYSSFRPVGIAIGIALLVLFAVFILLLGAGYVVRHSLRGQQQEAVMFDEEAATPATHRAPRASLFPLSLPSMCFKPSASRSSSTEHILIADKPLHRDFSDTSTLASSTAKDSKFSADDVQLHHPQQTMPLPPPPSYQEMRTTGEGPVRSVSGSSWITEGPATTIDTPVRGQGGRRSGRGWVRSSGRNLRRI